MSSNASGEFGAAETWYMVYTDDEGVVHTVKGTIKGIRRSFKEGLLGDAENVRVARIKDGPFEKLKSYPEFRDLVIQPAKLPTPASKDSDASAKKLATSIPLPQATGSSANLSESMMLAKTTPMSVVATAVADATTTPARPTINLKANGSTFTAELWRWFILGIIFASAGVLVTFLLPLVRHIRLF